MKKSHLRKGYQRAVSIMYYNANHVLMNIRYTMYDPLMKCYKRICSMIKRIDRLINVKQLYFSYKGFTKIKYYKERTNKRPVGHFAHLNNS